MLNISRFQFWQGILSECRTFCPQILSTAGAAPVRDQRTGKLAVQKRKKRSRSHHELKAFKNDLLPTG